MARLLRLKIKLNCIFLRNSASESSSNPWLFVQKKTMNPKGIEPLQLALPDLESDALTARPQVL
jgi:hypothetical protein